MKEEIEKLNLDMREMYADAYLGKDIKHHYKKVADSIERLNDIITLHKGFTDKQRAFVIEMAYRYYILKDILLRIR